MKKILQSLALKAGYEIKKRNHNAFSFEWIKEMGINSIIDVGANQGQFAMEIAKQFPNTPIYSFEPIASVFEVMKKNVAHLNVKPYHFGIGAFNEKSVINHTTYGNATSSILEMGENHYNNFPDWTKTVKEDINIITLDSFLEKEKLAKNIFLKIDVQGYEDKVLAGATEALKEIKIVQMETSFQEMYKGQQLFEYFHPLMLSKGFELAGIIDVCYDKNNGMPLYCDTFYVRK
jgi:FkbM family methyltransferase